MIPPGPPSLVQVRALPFVRKCKRIELVPVTTSDWELLELSAQSLEAGDLLNQVRKNVVLFFVSCANE